MNENVIRGIEQIKQLTPSLMGKFIYYLLPIRYRIIKINVDLVFKETLSSQLKKKFIQSIYSHWAKFIVEFLILPLLPTGYIKKKIRIKDQETPLAHLENNKSVLIIGGHCGNFELAVLSAYLFYKRTSIIVRRKQKNKFFNRMIQLLLQKYHLKMTNDPFELCRKLAPNNHLFFLPIDNGLGKKPSSALVNFFDLPVYTYTLSALLSKNEFMHPFFVSIFRNDKNEHIIEIQPEIDKKLIQQLGNKEQIMQYYYQLLEKTIMQHPEQWLGWALKKWQIDDSNRYKK